MPLINRARPRFFMTATKTRKPGYKIGGDLFVKHSFHAKICGAKLRLKREDPSMVRGLLHRNDY